MRSIEKNELNKKHTIQMIDLEKLKRVKINAIWKIIKNHKRKIGKKTLNDKIDFDRFSSFYSKLILNDTHYSDEHKRIKLVVENKCDELKNQIFEEAFE
jgi:signal transduction histidine kinase